MLVELGSVESGDFRSLTRKIKRVFIHDDYDYESHPGHVKNDIALVRLKYGVSKPKVKKGKKRKWNSICLPTQDLSFNKTTELEFAGWGLTEESSIQQSRYLQKGKYHYDGGILCADKFGYLGYAGPKYFCIIHQEEPGVTLPPSLHTVNILRPYEIASGKRESSTCHNPLNHAFPRETLVARLCMPLLMTLLLIQLSR